ncbi:hypothetical protein BGZ68_009894 [Mortierella alpina]|nr:hypothetical protein BGZ68_009894 [Mortierella alpina]
MHFGPTSALISLALMVIADGLAPPIPDGVDGLTAPDATFEMEAPKGAPKMVPAQPNCWDKVKEDYTFSITCDEPAWHAWADCDRRRYTSPLIQGSYRVRITCVSPIQDCGAYVP